MTNNYPANSRTTSIYLTAWTEEAIRDGDHPEQAKLNGLHFHYSFLKLKNQYLKQELAWPPARTENAKKFLGILPRKW